MKRTLLLAALLAVGAPTLTSVFAQSIEVGGTVGTGARGTESKLVRREARPIAGLHVGGWWADRLETALRISWVDLPNISSSQTRYYGCESGPGGSCLPKGHVEVVRQRVGERRFVAGQVLYHFLRGQRLRPYIGLGIGTIRDREMVSCDVADCEALLPGLHFGKRSYSYTDPASIIGVSALIWNRVVLRGGVHFHRLAGEELSLVETSVQVGYRFTPW